MPTTISKIRKLLEAQKQMTAKELREQLGVSQVLIHRHLKRLVNEGKIRKVGAPPKVFYLPSPQEAQTLRRYITSEIIEENWLEILPDGQFLYGVPGFEYWCHGRKYDPLQKQKEYETLFREKEKLKQNGLLDATGKISQSFDTNYLEKVWYIDFYSWEIFGKTLLGKLILYAKQNSDIRLMKHIADRIKTPLLQLLSQEKFALVGIIPHSVPRKQDFLHTTLRFLQLDPIPERIFEKIFSGHVVAQKTLKSKEEREQNAEKTLFLKRKIFPKKILFIDDACGSGATLNIAAKKVKAISPTSTVFGLTFVGSLKGFEVISDI